MSVLKKAFDRITQATGVKLPIIDLTLSTEDRPAFSFQWQFDGIKFACQEVKLDDEFEHTVRRLSISVERYMKALQSVPTLDLSKRLEIGTVVRYEHGPTALMRISTVYPYADTWRYYGTQFFGGSCSASHHRIEQPTAAEIEFWNATSHERNRG